MTRFRYIFSIVVVLVAVSLSLQSCKSDATSGNTSGGGDAASADQTTQGADDAQDATPMKMKTPGEMIKDLEGFAQVQEGFRVKFMELRDRYNAIPAEVKQNALNCAELEARLDGFLEKGGGRVDELEQAIAVLKQEEQSKQNISTAASAQSGIVLYQGLVEEQKRSVAELTEQIGQLSKAIEQLKASIPKKGKGVVLFE